jgi:hypothetical protein
LETAALSHSSRRSILFRETANVRYWPGAAGQDGMAAKVDL